MVSPILFRLGFRFADKNFNCRTRDVSHARTRADIYKYINARARKERVSSGRRLTKLEFLEGTSDSA
jgi:hypothetical protein